MFATEFEYVAALRRINGERGLIATRATKLVETIVQLLLFGIVGVDGNGEKRALGHAIGGFHPVVVNAWRGVIRVGIF